MTTSTDHAGTRGRPPGRFWLIGCVLAVLAAALAYVAVPRPAPVAEDVSGDAELAERVRGLLGDHDAVGVTVLLDDGRTVRQASLGTTDGSTPVRAGTPFESGSTQKLLTATLLADMVESGDVALDDTLGELWPDVDFSDPDTAGITLERLATHTSGLPKMPSNDPGLLPGNLAFQYFGANPNDFLGAPIAAVAHTDVSGGEQEFGYSNLGYATLGQTLARVAERPYPELLAERVLTPLGMEHTTVRASGAPEGGALPYRTPTAPVTPWASATYAPAGTGTWTTAGDMHRLLEAAADKDVPLTRLTHQPRATDPTEAEYDGRVGLGWMLWNVDGTSIAWHNGETGGSHAFVGHTDDGRSVVVLANTSGAPAEYVGLSLLGAEVPELAGDDGPPLVQRAVQVFFAVGLPTLVLLSLLRGTSRARGRRSSDRLGVLAFLALATVLWVVGLRNGAGGLASMVVWSCGGGLLALSAALAGYRWRDLPLVSESRPRLSWLTFALNLAVAAALLYGVVAVLVRMP